jgi:thiamine-phosphate pyrophosphorylase
LLLYYITDRKQFPGDESARRTAILEKIAEAARCGVDFIQLREKDLSGRELEKLAQAAFQAVRENSQPGTDNRERRTRVLINSRTDIAIACGADGVHLTSNDVGPQDVHLAWELCPRARGEHGSNPLPVVGVSCHSIEDVERAASSGADFAVFAPVFEKRDAPSAHLAGLEKLRDACRQKIPVLALGGITVANVRQCLDAGAAGIAGIRLFQENEVAEAIRSLRG